MSAKQHGCLWMLVCLAIVCGEDAGAKVVKYSALDFESNVGKQPHFVMFYAPWCGHCKRLSPTWDELGNEFQADSNSNVVIAKVDCTQDTDLCSAQDVTGHPTMKFYNGDASDPVRYSGPRTTEALKNFIKEQINGPEEEKEEEAAIPKDGLYDLNEGNFNHHVEVGLHFIKFYAPWCGHCQRLQPVWEELARSYSVDATVSIGKVDCTVQKSLCVKYEVKGYPTLLLFNDGKVVEKYQGERSHQDFKRFLNERVEELQARNNFSGEKIPPQSLVVEMRESNFHSTISEGVTFVKFFVPWCGHCKHLAPIWEQVAEKLVGNNIVKLAQINCDSGDNKSLCNQYEVLKYPTLILFRNGINVQEFNGNRSLEGLYDFVMGHLQHEEL